jgi:ferredoxin, 2Fe-2S
MPPNSPPSVEVTFILQDPAPLTGRSEHQVVVVCGKGESLLDVALAHGIHMDHACGGVCACSTCHVYVNQGSAHLSEPSDAELDRVEEAPGLQRNSRLACQSIVIGDGPIVVEIPAWNRNAVQETPH